MKFVAISILSIAAVAAGLTGCASDASDSSNIGTSVGEDLSAASNWQTLGSSEVNGALDHDAIVVGAEEGAFTAIKIRVQGSALVMENINIVFGDDSTFSPNVRLVFDQNTSSRSIDLPGNARFIKRVEFKYGNLPGGGKASVQLLGKGTAPSPWESFGERVVDGRLDTDRIVVGAGEGPVTSLKLHVEDSALLMFNVKVTFGDGQTFSPNVRLVFDQDSASRVIDLPGAARIVQRVDFQYGNLPGGGSARVELMGKTVTASPWQNLGDREVSGAFDTDRLAVGTDEGKFRAIQVRVEDSALLMFNVKVTFGNGETFSPNVRLVFDENTTSREIDLPGDARFIQKVEFQYGNLPTGGNADVQLWGKR